MCVLFLYKIQTRMWWTNFAVFWCTIIWMVLVHYFVITKCEYCIKAHQNERGPSEMGTQNVKERSDLSANSPCVIHSWMAKSYNAQDFIVVNGKNRPASHTNELFTWDQWIFSRIAKGDWHRLLKIYGRNKAFSKENLMLSLKWMRNVCQFPSHSPNECTLFASSHRKLHRDSQPAHNFYSHQMMWMPWKKRRYSGQHTSANPNYVHNVH